MNKKRENTNTSWTHQLQHLSSDLKRFGSELRVRQAVAVFRATVHRLAVSQQQLKNELTCEKQDETKRTRTSPTFATSLPKVSDVSTMSARGGKTGEAGAKLTRLGLAAVLVSTAAAGSMGVSRSKSSCAE